MNINDKMLPMVFPL